MANSEVVFLQRASWFQRAFGAALHPTRPFPEGNPWLPRCNRAPVLGAADLGGPKEASHSTQILTSTSFLSRRSYDSAPRAFRLATFFCTPPLPRSLLLWTSMCVCLCLVAQSCPTLATPQTVCNLPGSSVHVNICDCLGTLRSRGRILVWASDLYSRPSCITNWLSPGIQSNKERFLLLIILVDRFFFFFFLVDLLI